MLDKQDMEEMEEIGAIVGLERTDGEDWMAFAIRLVKAYDQPLLKVQYGTTIDRLVKLVQKLRTP